MPKSRKGIQKKRLGRFFVNGKVAREMTANMAETLAMIRFFPVNVIFRTDIDAFQMIGISDRFDEIEEGSITPTYELVIKTTDDGGVETVEVNRDKEEVFLVDQSVN
jgi:hypothetical protein